MLLKSDLDVQQTHLRGRFVEQRLMFSMILGVTKFIKMRDMISSQFVVLLKSDLDKGSCLTQASGVTKFINMRYMILVTLCCAT